MAQLIKVLLVLDHAPDYRETFLGALGAVTELTVVAQPCSEASLTPPSARGNYEYLELHSMPLGGLRWQAGMVSLLRGASRWDVICVDLNLRHLSRLVGFLMSPSLWKKWIWRGHIFGRATGAAVETIRGALIRRAGGCLTYSEEIAGKANEAYGVQAVSFNNTEIRAEEFRSPQVPQDGPLRLLFVGRNQPRKRLERLIALAADLDFVRVRLVGPGMESVEVPPELGSSGRVEIVGRTMGDALHRHFDWADVVVNPGHVGLLVMNAARHGKGIVIDSDSAHAPEVALAREAGQPFLRFSDWAETLAFFTRLREQRTEVFRWGVLLQERAREGYTIDVMVARHLQAFRSVVEGEGSDVDA